MQERDVILLHDPDVLRHAECRQILDAYYECMVVADLAEAQARLTQGSVAAMVVRGLASTAAGVEVCRALSRNHPALNIILLTGDDQHRLLLEAFNDKIICRCLIEPVSPQDLTIAVRDAVRRHEMDRVQTMLVQRAAEIDRHIVGGPYWLYRFRMSCQGVTRLVAGSVGLCVVASLLLLMAGVGIFLLLYYIKSAMGIDLFRDKHLKDCLMP